MQTLLDYLMYQVKKLCSSSSVGQNGKCIILSCVILLPEFFPSAAYTSFSLDTAPYLGPLPLHEHELAEYDLSPFIAAGATEILVYAFITVKSAEREKPRAVYDIYTTDDSGNRYSQFMNVAFPEDDFVVNSANLYLPIISSKQLHIEIPSAWSANYDNISKKVQAHSYKNLNEAMQDYMNGDEAIYSGVFLLGYYN